MKNIVNLIDVFYKYANANMPSNFPDEVSSEANATFNRVVGGGKIKPLLKKIIVDAVEVAFQKEEWYPDGEFGFSYQIIMGVDSTGNPQPESIQLTKIQASGIKEVGVFIIQAITNRSAEITKTLVPLITPYVDKLKTANKVDAGGSGNEPVFVTTRQTLTLNI